MPHPRPPCDHELETHGCLAHGAPCAVCGAPAECEDWCPGCREFVCAKCTDGDLRGFMVFGDHVLADHRRARDADLREAAQRPN